MNTPQQRADEVMDALTFPPAEGTPEAESYAKFVESMVPFCHCAERHRPCDGVLAGGLCDNMQDDAREYDDEECDE